MMRRLLGVLLALPGLAAAQSTDGFDAHGLQLAAYDGDLRDPLLVQRPGRTAAGEWFAGGVLEFSQGLLVAYESTDGGPFEPTPWLTDLFALNLSVGGTPHERIRFDAAMPLVFTSRGADGPNGVDAGDLRVSAMVMAVLPDHDDEGFGLGIVGSLDVPTGAPAEFLGQRTVAGGGKLAATWARDRFTLSADAGAQFVPSLTLDNLHGSDSFVAGLGLGLLVHETTSLNLEGRVSVPFTRAGRPGTETPSEAVFTVRHRQPAGWHLLAGAAAGIAPGASAGAWRVFLGGGYGHIKEHAPLADLDVRVMHEGVPWEDAPVTLTGPAGDERSWRSSDKVRHVRNLPPHSDWVGTAQVPCHVGRAEVTLGAGGSVTDMVIDLLPSLEATVRFHVVDTDGRGIPDVAVWWKEAPEGCFEQEHITLDARGEGSQPAGAGRYRVFVEAPGYQLVQRDVAVPQTGEVRVDVVLERTRVAVTDTEIVILEAVLFAFDDDQIEPASFPLLDEVAATILRNDLRVEVQGHTDWVGSDAYNLDLSDRRAASVRRYLLAQGVADSDLLAHGYGEAQPIADNETDAGRALNRRVVFKILTPEP